MSLQKFNNKILKFSNKILDVVPPYLPSDMDFIYQAKDFDGSKIPNKAPNSTFGDYLEYGTLTLNGTGANSYLSNGNSDANYLYKNLTTAELNNIKAVNNTYTFFIRVMQTTSGTGAIACCRQNDGYIYMIRSDYTQLQIHTTTGYNCGTDFTLTTDRVYKVVINGASFKAYNLDNNAEYSVTYSTNRNMGTKLTTFNAGNNGVGESVLDRFYAMAGIPRATTAEEDALIKQTLMNQSA